MTLRTNRVASLIREEIGMFFTREYRDNSYGLITVTDVQMTPDLRIAKIFVSILGEEKKKNETLVMLNEQKSHIRGFIGSNVRLKFTPSIQFYLDDTLDRVEKINQLIKKTHAENNPED
ncbi:MAG: 30S ribosome-binding factor RbfA [Bacteroidota bacterium]